MGLKIGTAARHPSYGPGTVRQILGALAIVDFFGEEIEVATADLMPETPEPAPVQEGPSPRERTRFRRAFEAINLGVVPPSPDQLVALSIQGNQIAHEALAWLAAAPHKGLCKVIFGDYGTGKTHRLRLIEAAALHGGWAVSFVEFDPKQADPAKPHLAYRAITSNIRFPSHTNGSQSRGFYDFVREIRNGWPKVAAAKYMPKSPWFQHTLEALRYFPHCEERDYLDAIDWLAGQPVSHQIVRSLRTRSGGRIPVPPSMPKTLETADIYVFHLVVINELCRLLGYKGLLLILDEAEHVRSYNVRRRERANNFFDMLARSAHPRVPGDSHPVGNEHGYSLSHYWKEGPHFGLVVGLTEGDLFSDPSLPLREACVFLHDEDDRVRLKAPRPKDYQHWCVEFLTEFVTHYPDVSELIASEDARAKLADVWRQLFFPMLHPRRLSSTTCTREC